MIYKVEVSGWFRNGGLSINKLGFRFLVFVIDKVKASFFFKLLKAKDVRF